MFGNATIDNQHITDYSLKNGTENDTIVNQQFVKMMNPLNYIGEEKVDVSQHWRVRHGNNDRDTSLAISTILSLTLNALGSQVLCGWL